MVSSSSPNSSPSSPLSSLPPIPPSRFQDARALAVELGGGALLDMWAQTLERYQRTLTQFKTRILQAERGMTTNQGQDPNVAVAQAPKTSVSSVTSLWEIEGEGDGEWCGGVGEGGLQPWGSLASLFRPQNCSTLKIGEEKKKEGAAGAAGGGKFLQNLLNPSKKSVSGTFYKSVRVVIVLLRECITVKQEALCLCRNWTITLNSSIHHLSLPIKTKPEQKCH